MRLLKDRGLFCRFDLIATFVLLWGCHCAEIIPYEPDAASTAEGKSKTIPCAGMPFRYIVLRTVIVIPEVNLFGNENIYQRRAA